MSKIAKPVKTLAELRHKMAEKMAAFENGEITNADSKSYIGFAGIMIKSVAVEQIESQFQGVKRNIDFLEDENQRKKKIEDKASLSVSEVKPETEEQSTKSERPKAEYSNGTPYNFAKNNF